MGVTSGGGDGRRVLRDFERTASRSAVDMVDRLKRLERRRPLRPRSSRLGLRSSGESDGVAIVVVRERLWDMGLSI